jgi:hypothetical protein
MLAITVGGNAALAHTALSRIAAQLPLAVEKGKKAVATAVLLSTTRVMEERIYDEPLPASYARFGKTHRTGALLAGEAMVQHGDGWLITTLNEGVPAPHAGEELKNPQKYATWRHNQSGEDWQQGLWRTIGLERVEPELPQIFEKAFAPALLRND